MTYKLCTLKLNFYQRPKMKAV